MTKRVEVSAPGKLMLFGEHAVVYGRPCIVTAIDQRVYVGVEKAEDNWIVIDSPDVGIKNYSIRTDDLKIDEKTSNGVRFLVTGINRFVQERGLPSNGLRVDSRSDFSSKVGFGSSSAVTVGLIAALGELDDRRLSNEEVFRMAYQSVLDIQGVGSGFDLAAAVWGGTIFYQKNSPVQPLIVDQLPLVVGYTGIKADTTTLVRRVGDLYAKNKGQVTGIFDLIGQLVNEAKLLFGNLDIDDTRLGDLMNINQGLLDALGVNSYELSKLIFASRNDGAWGAKLSGAGGGDCMIALVPDNKRVKVEDGINNHGGKVINVRINAEGVRREL